MSVKIIIDDAKGLYQTGATSGGVVGIKQSRSSGGVSAGGVDKIVSGPITIPANSLITAYHAVITTQLDFVANADVGIRFGNSAAGDDDTYIVLDANDTATAVASLPLGHGNSTVTQIADTLDSLNESTVMTAVAGAQVIGDADVDIYGSLHATENIDADGAVQFVVEFITFS